MPAARHPDCIVPIMRDVRADSRAGLAEFNGDPERVHLLVNLPPTVGDLPAGQKPQRRVFPQAAAGIPRPATLLLAGETAKVRVARRRPAGEAAISVLRQYTERQDPPARPQPGPSALTAGLKTGALADILVAPEEGQRVVGQRCCRWA